MQDTVQVRLMKYAIDAAAATDKDLADLHQIKSLAERIVARKK